MGISRARHRAFLLTLCSLSSLSLLATPIAGASNSDLVYKGCSNQTSAITGITSAISAVATSLTTQSASSKFYKTTSSNSGGGSAVFGLFQCRGDLNPSDCSACVSQALPMWAQLCGPTAAAARVQLTGCLALYQIQGFPQVSGTQLLFKTCGSGGGGGDFEVRRDTAFAQLESGIGGGVGFYATQYQSVYAMAQCEGDLSSGDCAECINQAVQKSEVECGGASSGQVYLDKCYISYNYYRNGFPHGGIGGGGGGGAGGQQTSKTVAIVLGSAVGLGFLVICLLFARNLVKKKDEN